MLRSYGRESIPKMSKYMKVCKGWASLESMKKCAKTSESTWTCTKSWGSTNKCSWSYESSRKCAKTWESMCLKFHKLRKFKSQNLRKWKKVCHKLRKLSVLRLENLQKRQNKVLSSVHADLEIRREWFHVQKQKVTSRKNIYIHTKTWMYVGFSDVY